MEKTPKTLLKLRLQVSSRLAKEGGNRRMSGGVTFLKGLGGGGEPRKSDLEISRYKRKKKGGYANSYQAFRITGGKGRGNVGNIASYKLGLYV